MNRSFRVFQAAKLSERYRKRNRETEQKKIEKKYKKIEKKENRRKGNDIVRLQDGVPRACFRDGTTGGLRSPRRGCRFWNL